MDTAAAAKPGTVTITCASGNLSAILDIPVSLADSFTLSVAPPSLTLGGTASLTAALKNKDGSAAVPNGTLINFASSDKTIGTITEKATTSNGVATALFDTTAATKAGAVDITATAAGGHSAKVTMEVAYPSTGSIEFKSATPSIIGLKNSGSAETSVVVFSVKDTNGKAVADGTAVDICLKGPSGGRLASSGGEYVGDLVIVSESIITDANSNGCYDTGGDTYTDSNNNNKYDSPLYTSVSTSGGNASVVLHTGSVAGNVTIIASVVGKSLSTSSSTISIGGGVLSNAHFTVGADNYALITPSIGLATANISVYLADRFGNGNVLTGTTVSFYSESGATEASSVAVDGKGYGTTVFRTQNPLPKTVPVQAWETTLKNRLYKDYGVSTSNFPRKGWGSILVMAKGEEDFTDANVNGVYDSGETFVDSAPEPFIDYNDSDERDDGSGASPFEQYVDVNNSGAYDGTPNGVWDASKTLFKEIKMILSYSPTYIVVNRINPSFSVTESATAGGPSAGAYYYRLAIYDAITQGGNLLYLSPEMSVTGTGKKIAATFGTVPGMKSYRIFGRSTGTGQSVAAWAADATTGFTTATDFDSNDVLGTVALPTTSETFNIPSGGSQKFRVLVADQNLNPLASGTMVTISAFAALPGGTTASVPLSGTASYSFPKTFTQGPVELEFTLTDNTTEVTARACTITVSVAWQGATYSTTLSGTLN